MSLEKDFASVLADAPLDTAFASKASEGDVRVDLLETIEQQVIPRLLLAHCQDAPATRAPRSTGAAVPSGELEAFASLVLAYDVAGALARIDELCRSGRTLESVFLDLIAPVARQLGHDWETDTRSFAAVTVGLGALQQIVNTLSESDARQADGPRDRDVFRDR